MKTVSASPRLRRAYFECRYGQLHVHNAIPDGGGFDEATTLICLHSSSSNGHSFRGVSRILGATRSVYCPDTPGCGESDQPPAATNIESYAAAIGDFLDSMRFRSVDLLGAHSGAAMAAELAIARPKQVRRVVMIGAPLLNGEERKKYESMPPPEGMSATAAWARAAAIMWHGEQQLPLVKQPLLVLRPKDNFWEAGARVKALVPAAKVVEMPEHGRDVLETAAEVVTKEVLEFFA